jgi:outer membrane lipoprotein-sorting protein
MLSTTPEEKPANISLAALQDKMQKAMDPDGVFRKSKSYVQRQIKIVKKDWEDEKGYIVETKYKRPDKLKMTTWEDNAPKTSIIFNGTNAWIVNYDSKFRKKITGDDLEKMKVIFLLGRPGSTYQEIFKDVQVAEVEIDEQPYYKLNCISKFKDQPPFIVYVGKNNFLTKRIDIPPKVTSTIEKYGLYDGVIIPERISEQLGDSETQYRLIMYKLNVEINDSDFFPPLFE